jgi:hypothetical protein
MAVHLVVFPIAFVAVAIGPLVKTVTIYLPVLPIAFVAVAIGPL